MTRVFSSFFKKLVNLREGAEDKRTIIENVKDDADISSARFWTLVCAIGVASVGLNINSIPVIIGAMLISPLMGPIVSAGMAMSINDWGLLRRSLRNLFMLTLISIVISTVYFAISPISNAQSELLARIQPTIFDVLIAIFGGVAGFIGISRARQSNIIPGVAIATALMPPLCTVGYGLATMQPVFIFGAFYLFVINSIFICLSALVVSSYMRLPKRVYQDEADKKRVNRIITVITLVIIAPAVYTAYTFVQQNNFNQNSAAFVTDNFTVPGHIIVYKNINYNQIKSTIELAFLGSQFTDEEIAALQAKLADYNLNETELIIRQDDFSLSEAEWQEVVAEMKSDDDQIKLLETRLELEGTNNKRPSQLLDEANILFPEMQAITIGDGISTGSETAHTIAIITLQATTTDLATQNQISQWLQTRLNDDTVQIIYQFATSTDQY